MWLLLLNFNLMDILTCYTYPRIVAKKYYTSFPVCFFSQMKCYIVYWFKFLINCWAQNKKSNLIYTQIQQYFDHSLFLLSSTLYEKNIYNVIINILFWFVDH